MLGIGVIHSMQTKSANREPIAASIDPINEPAAYLTHSLRMHRLPSPHSIAFVLFAALRRATLVVSARMEGCAADLTDPLHWLKFSVPNEVIVPPQVADH